jgi:hypothetical protein
MVRDARAALLTMRGESSILGLVHQRAFLDPRHRVAELDADLLDRVLRELARVALNEVWLTLFSSIQSRANLPDCMLSSTRLGAGGVTVLVEIWPTR